MKQHPLRLVLPAPKPVELRIVRRGRPPQYVEKELVQALQDAAYDPGRLVKDAWGRYLPPDDPIMLSRRQYQEWAWKQKRPVPSANTIVHYYDSWSAALDVAGLRPWQRPPRKKP